MLMEISCEKFNKNNKKVKFNSGLNVILGDNYGSNSIGKSTFLMIVDFVFGGDDYISKCPDVHKHVGDHEIKFVFLFGQKLYAFGRKTDKSNWVIEYDGNGVKKGEIKTDDFKNFLKEKYNIGNSDLSFRSIISPHFRVYQRKNYDEHRPLHTYLKEKDSDAVIRLIKLYDLYRPIKEQIEKVTNNKEKLKVYKESQKKEFIPNIDSSQYKENKKKILEVNKELENISETIYKDVLEADSSEIAETIQLKKTISLLRSKITKYKNKLDSLDFIIEESGKSISSDVIFYKSLKKFFPNAKVEKLSEVDNFHYKLCNILNLEVTEEIDYLKTLIEQCEIELEKLLLKMDSYPIKKQVSKIVLSNIETILLHKNSLELEIASYDNKKFYQNNKEMSDKALNEKMKKVLKEIENKINTELTKLNDYVYSISNKPPVLSLSNKKYEYKTCDDCGTGVNFKNLIIIDICLLKQTGLPVLIHDSLLFKNIANEPIENILKLYTEFNKQIFIVFDKVNSYSVNIQKLLDIKKVLSLSKNEKTLFGFTWNNE